MNRGETQNIFGMANILDDNEEADLNQIEKAIINGGSMKKHKPKDHVGDYEKDIKKMMMSNKDTRLDDDADPFGLGSFNFSNTNNPGNYGGVKRRSNIDDDARSVKSSASSKSNRSVRSHRSNHSIRSSHSHRGGQTYGAQQRQEKKIHHSWGPANLEDPYAAHITDEEKKQYHINSVLHGIKNRNANGNDDADNEYVDKEEEEDELADLIERCNDLRSQLEDEVDLSKIDVVNFDTPKDKAKMIYRILQRKYDRLRYSDMCDEILLAGFYGLESVFDGKREWFGHKPDLTGWADTAKVKLRRLRPSTSAIVAEAVKGHNVTGGWRIAMELLPSLFLYSKQRKRKTSDDLSSDEDYKEALHNMEK
jgi:hypothetical protein